MKHPKLKQTVLCQILLYLPAIIPFFYIAVFALFPDERNDSNPLIIGGFFLTVGLSIWYLFRNLVLLMLANCLFCSIRQWKKDRKEYRTRRNGNDRKQIRETILRRCACWGRRFKMRTDSAENVDVYYRHGYSWTVFLSAIEKRVAVCTTDTLSVEQYRFLTNQASRMFSAVPNGKIILKTKEEREAPRALANVILFLADTVEDDVKELARKPLKKEDYSCTLPCVIECSEGKYYTNCVAEYYEQGMMPRPVENFAAAMIRQLVFSWHLPKENIYTQPELDSEYNIETSFWEFLKTVRNDMKEVDDELQKDRIKALRRMKDGEARIEDGIIWYKHEDKLAEYAFWADEDDEMLVVLIPNEVWYYKKNNAFLLRDSLNRKKMKKQEQEYVQKRIEAKLIAEGYRIAEE